MGTISGTRLEAHHRERKYGPATASGRPAGYSAFVVSVRDEIIKTGITTREATKSMAQFLRAKLPIDRVTDLANAAKNLGVTVANMSSSEVFGRFIQVVQTGNSALLDAVGITKNVSVFYKEYAAEVGKGVNQLTTYEKQLAVINGLVGETATVQGVYNEAMKTAGKQLSSMKRLFEEATLVIGERFEPLLAKLISSMNKLLKWFVQLPDATHDAIANFIKWTAIIGTLTGALLNLLPILKSIAPVISLIGRRILVAMPWFAAIAAAIGAMIVIIKAFKIAWEEDFGGIQDAIGDLASTIQTIMGPIVEDVFYWFNAIKTEITTTIELISTIIAEMLISIKALLCLERKDPL